MRHREDASAASPRERFSEGSRQPSASTSSGSIYVRVPALHRRGASSDTRGLSGTFESQTTKLLVAVRTRPVERDVETAAGETTAAMSSAWMNTSSNAVTLTNSTQSLSGCVHRMPTRSILRVVNRDTVVVMDPDEEKPYLDQVQGRTKSRRYTFDVAFSGTASNAEVYEATGKGLISSVVNGMNSTVFAYGATGSGKTHTMIGNYDEPGMMFLSLVDIFNQIDAMKEEYEFEVSCSYLEVYNELIYDLLVVESSPLELREDPERGPVPVGLTRIAVRCADDITKLLHEGNERRSIDYTEANATSSRSHAVLEISVKRWARRAGGKEKQVLCGKLSLVDLAGSERASDTLNSGQKLRDGANINKSLLALANCINALGRHSNSKIKGRMYIPYRNSKLTRLLKDGLSGNSRTAMIATVSASSQQYNHTINTLKYANRAKEIKTNVAQNVVIARERHHIGDYQHVIDDLQSEVARLKTQLANKDIIPRTSQTQTTTTGCDGSSLSETWLDVLSDDINENVEERINIQKALFELEDVNAQNVYERSALKRRLTDIVDQNPSTAERSTLRSRIDAIDETIRANEVLGAKYRKDVEANELVRVAIQSRIDAAINDGKSPSFLRILSQYRLVGVRNMELHFQLAIRDQIINEQRDVVRGLWDVMAKAGLSKAVAIDIANREGIRIYSARTNVPSHADASHHGSRKDGGAVADALKSGKRWNSASPNIDDDGASPKTRSAKAIERSTAPSSIQTASPLASRRHVAALERVATRTMMSTTSTTASSRPRTADRAARPLSARPMSVSTKTTFRDNVRASVPSSGEIHNYIQRIRAPNAVTSEPRGSARLIEARATRAARHVHVNMRALSSMQRVDAK